MKKFLFTVLVLGLCFSPFAARAAEAQSGGNLPGRKIAETVSMITGVAISPLLGVGAVGAYQWWQAKTPEQKARLPWFANPTFWIPALLLVAACVVKDTAGTVLPTAAKKPLDVAEAVEHKVSGLVAAGAFVPIAAAIFHSSNPGDGASLSAAGFAAIDLHWLYNALMVPISLAAFAVVFLASNAINILILLSPFTTVDAALKAFRAAILASIAGTSLANPWIGLVWALVVILLSWLIAGWSFRLSHFGMVFVWDFFTLRRARFTPDKVANKMFLGRNINEVPARTYGKLSRDEKGNLVLKYRPWLVLAERTLTLPEAKYAVGKGAFTSEILELQGDESKTACLLPPRYRSHEEELVTIYGFVDVRP
ncbi:MAG: hypothetical protein EPO07_08985, partial [Verrucomicrobia bacterium]